MRIALISDIHGNLVALETVLLALERETYDQLVFLGDAAALGPQPREVLQVLRRLGCPCIMGNTDEALLKPLDNLGGGDEQARLVAQFRWNREQLGTDDLNFLSAFRPTIRLPLDREIDLLCFHGSPRSYNDIILATTASADLEPMFAGTAARVLAGGHTHAQMFRRHRDLILVNPGSIGLPFENRNGRRIHPPWAEFGFIALQGGELSVDLRRVPLDVAAVCQAPETAEMPYLDQWAATWQAN